MYLILFGAPGVGKGTQAKILSSTLDLKHISTGDILRTEIASGSDFGIKAKALMDKGELVPDELIADVIRLAINDALNYNGFILDGFPRTVDQAKLLEKIVKELKIPAPALVILKGEDDIIVRRLSKRRQCANCGMIVNLSDLAHKEICPTCKAVDKFIVRKDDKEEVIINRLKVYRAETRPVVAYLEDKLKTFRIDALQPVAVVTQNIMQALK
ncbi:MAG: adenylate kinase [Bacteroidetes bacterium]|nr:adenylate kinase [Bacteroidota bacterium]